MADFLCQRKASALSSNLSVNSLGKISLGLLQQMDQGISLPVLYCSTISLCTSQKQIYFLTSLRKVYCAVICLLHVCTDQFETSTSTPRHTPGRVLSRVFEGQKLSPQNVQLSPPKKILLSLQYISNYIGKINQTQQGQCT